MPDRALTASILVSAIWLAACSAQPPMIDYAAQFNALAASGQPDGPNRWDELAALAREIEQQTSNEGVYFGLPAEWAQRPDQDEMVAVRARLAELKANGLFERTKLLAEPVRFIAPAMTTPMVESLASDTLLEVFGGLRGLAQVESSRLAMAILDDDEAAATTAVREDLGIARTLMLHPSAISRLVGISITALATSTVNSALDAGRVNGDMAHRLLAVFETSMHFPPIERTLAGERLSFLDMEQYFGAIEPDSTVAEMLDIISDPIEDTIEFVKNYSDILGAARLGPAGRRRAGKTFDHIESVLGHAPLEAQPGIGPMGSSILVNEWERTMIEATRLRLGLEIYRSEHGRYPDALDALVPEVFAELPRDDHADDGRFIYRLVNADNPDSTYTLYTVGLDGHDDGGVESEEHPNLAWYKEDASGIDFLLAHYPED